MTTTTITAKQQQQKKQKQAPLPPSLPVPSSSSCRDLDEEFNVLLPLYQGNDDDEVIIMERFATLFIDTLKAEPRRHLWTELVEKFPVEVRLWAMKEMRLSFMRRLGISASATNRWSAKLDLQRHDARLLEIIINTKEEETEGGPAAKEAQERIVNECLTKCTALMFAMLKNSNGNSNKETASPPTSVSDLRHVLDTTHSPALQLRVLERERQGFMKLFPSMFNSRETFTYFKEGVKLGKLYDEDVSNTTLETKSALESQLQTMASQLQQRLLAFDSLNLPDQILDQYPSMVKYRVLGQEQCALMTQMRERITCNQRLNLPCIREIRGIVAGLKDELGSGGTGGLEYSEAMTQCRLLSGLRRLTWVNTKKKASRTVATTTTTTSSMIIINDAISALPTKIVLTAIENTCSSSASLTSEERSLDEKLISLFDTQPPHVFIPVMVGNIRSILDASPEHHHKSLLYAHAYVKNELVPLANERKRKWKLVMQEAKVVVVVE